MVDGMVALDNWNIVLRLVLAAAFGGMLGLEREVDGHEAGLRTHLLVSLGAALFGVTSVGAWDDFTAPAADTNVQVDITRIASYVAPGVGFIGGGVILKHVGMVKGITTATSLWCAAAIGLATGVGFWVAALTATILGLVALAGLKPISNLAGRLARRKADAVIVELEPGSHMTEVVELIDQIGRQNVRQLQVGSGNAAGCTEIRAELWEQPERAIIAELLSRLSERPEVRSVYHSNQG